MNLKNVNFLLEDKELRYLKIKARDFVSTLKTNLKKKKIKADVFVGGSFGKGTLTKSDGYDVDIFVRFDKKYKDLTKELKKILPRNGKKVHGSRDYFKFGDGKLDFEVVPVLKIRKPQDAENVTDLSYFHVSYVKKKLNSKLEREVSLAKRFCKAQGFYGAESYINGFSGYALECLIIHYNSFNKMLRELVKVKEKLVIDPARHYKRKADALIELNDSKTKGPLVLVDPTFKERNILAALNHETFEKFRAVAKKFLRNSSEMFFVTSGFDVEKFRKKKGEFVHVALETNRQEGDIAGTKMKKFSRLLVMEFDKYFDILGKEFVYNGGKSSDFYLIVKSRKKIVRRGPPVKDKKNAMKFRKKNKKVVVKKGILYAHDKIDFSGAEFVLQLKKKDKDKIKEMGIVSLKIHRT